MADDEVPPPIRLMNFVSEDQLEEARKNRGARVEDGTAQRDRSLYEILKENKDKKDVEFNERFKHRPPKALDDDETEFLDKLEMSRREQEQQIADEEEKELRSFQAAVEAQSTVVHEITDVPSIPKIQDKKSVIGRKNPPRPIGMVIKVKPQAKKSKVDHSAETLHLANEAIDENTKLIVSSVETFSVSTTPVAGGGLVSYSDESENDD
ncbi:hypothetical protein ACJIZ3_010526 [Penstemon smallii]|uniref:FAM192A/Fyv6 N-terminal domain-containing protein n=1 Tax=Penstemon smallii TaxID=265156 RepID=A0ABD3UGJ2_9LAMI